MDKVNFGDELVTRDEKTRRVAACLYVGCSQLRPDERPDVGRHAPPLEESLRRQGEAASGASHFRHGRRHRRHCFSNGRQGRQSHRQRHQSGHAGRGDGAGESARHPGLTGRSKTPRSSASPTTFDAYTIAFGIRNVTDIPPFEEAHRALKRGGRFYCLEFSTSEWPGFGELYDRYSEHLIPRSERQSPTTRKAIATWSESIRRFPKMDAFRAMIGDAGFKSTSVEPILGGLVAIHGGWKI